MENFDLSPLISEIDLLRAELGIARWSFLKAWADTPHVKDASDDELELLLERLCRHWADLTQ